MNSLQPSARLQQPLTLRDRVAAWRELLEECGRKPTRRRVHVLRVVTLRIQAELEHEVAELPHASHQAQAMLRFGKLAEKLREVLAPVREFDVWIGKLQRLSVSLGQSTHYIPRSTQEYIRQIGRMVDRLKKKRRSAAQKLIAQIARRRSDLQTVGDDLNEAASDRHGADPSGVVSILKQFAFVSADFPALDEQNLHDFRKRIKKVRYLAEIHQNTDAACAQIAALIKKAQTAVGEWHDWQALARTARHRRHPHDVQLGELLASLAAEKFAEAIGVCHHTKARMAELLAGAVHDSNGTRRKPPARNGHSLAASLRKLA